MRATPVQDRFLCFNILAIDISILFTLNPTSILLSSSQDGGELVMVADNGGGSCSYQGQNYQVGELIETTSLGECSTRTKKCGKLKMDLHILHKYDSTMVPS